MKGGREEGTIILGVREGGKVEEGVEKRRRITGKRIKGREKQDKSLNIKRISGCKDTYQNLTSVTLTPLCLLLSTCGLMLPERG